MSSASPLSLIEDIASISIKDLRAAVTSRTPGKRLLLPTIQRSLVWNNERIVNYWDTLWRGWFPGLMMIRRMEYGQDAYQAGTNTQTLLASGGDDELFDGQQRMTAILLGFGEGGLSRTHKLWIGRPEPDGKSAAQIAFRVTTIGQPFGYRVNAPNEKYPLAERRDASQVFATKHQGDKLSPEDVFARVTGEDLIDDAHWLWEPLAEAFVRPPKPADEIDLKLHRIIDTKVAIKRLSRSETDDYETFFQRIGQGGVPLSNDELVYSIIKNRFPAVRPIIEDIVAAPEIGHLSDPTSLALSALRLARVLANAQTHDPDATVPRPTPEWVRTLPRHNTEEPPQPSIAQNTATLFESWLVAPEGESTPLKTAFRAVRDLYAKDNDGKSAMPAILIARLPWEILDLALMLVGSVDMSKLPAQTRRAFLLWALFFADPSKVADALAKELANQRRTKRGAEDILLHVLADQELQGSASPVPTAHDFAKLYESTAHIEGSFQTWVQRFKAADTLDRTPSRFFGELFFWTPKTKNLLLWDQRAYLGERFPDYDPTSGRDEDLPIDLDHIVAQGRVMFHWSGEARQAIESMLSTAQVENFRALRHEIVNLAGNLRWLDGSDNRGRQKGGGDADAAELQKAALQSPNLAPFIELVNKLSSADGLIGWAPDDLYHWQSVVEQRTINLTECMVMESGIAQLHQAAMAAHEAATIGS